MCKFTGERVTFFLDKKNRLVGIKPDPTSKYKIVSKEDMITKRVGFSGFIKNGVKSGRYKAHWDPVQEMIIAEVEFDE